MNKQQSTLPDLGFSIYPAGKKKPGLIRAWLENRRITNECCEVGFIRADNLDWLLVLASKHEAQALDKHGIIYAIISFQEFKIETEEGFELHRYAIARQAKDRE